MRWILRVVLIALLALAGLYAGDYLSARYGIPGNRQVLGSVPVKVLWAVRQKSGRIEYSVGDDETQTCVRSLFPQLGYTPCWYLRGHAKKRIEIGRTGPIAPRPCCAQSFPTRASWIYFSPFRNASTMRPQVP